MNKWKFAAPLALAVLSASAIATAADDFIIVFNQDRVPHPLEWTTGDQPDCTRHANRGTSVVPAKSEIKLKIRNEAWACIRRPGGVWRKADLRGRKTVIRLRIDDPGK